MLVVALDDFLLAPHIDPAVAVQQENSWNGTLRDLRYEQVGGHPRVRRGLERQILFYVIAMILVPDYVGRGHDGGRRVEEVLKHSGPRGLLPYVEIAKPRVQEGKFEVGPIGLLLYERIQAADVWTGLLRRSGGF